MFGLVCLMVLFPGEYGLAGFSFLGYATGDLGVA